jgi:hypothetical protein
VTPFQLAQAHCANWRKDGKGCLGAIIDDDLQIRRCHPRPRCLLATPGQRCQYVEECVMPMARSIYEPVQRQQFEEAVRQYRLATKLPAIETRPCPDCGKAMDPRRRFCPACAVARRRVANRETVKRHRLTCKQLTQIAPLNTKGFEGPSNPVGMKIPATLPTR